MEKEILRHLPGIDRMYEIAKTDSFLKDLPKKLVVESIRKEIDLLRHDILSGKKNIPKENMKPSYLIERIKERSIKKASFNLVPLINATGIVVHTNLGRSTLPPSVLRHVVRISMNYSNLEYDLENGKRGLRYSAVEDVLCTLTGAESAMVVNNNAGAVLLCLDTLSKDKETIVSRGELVEIGGAFRIPDVMEKSGAILKEVGCTNRTHLKDYEGAITPETALLLKVHKSNYHMVGFTSEVALRDLVVLGNRYEIPVMEDLGSGTLIDFSRYQSFREPTVQESILSGVKIVTFSGDKLLGGPQAGIIVGNSVYVEKIRKNPLTRALRIDKLTLAALEATLRFYLDEKKAVQLIPTLKMLTLNPDEIRIKAEILKEKIDGLACNDLSIVILEKAGRVGGGALPLISLSSYCLGVRSSSCSVNHIESFFRNYRPPIIGRIEDDSFLLDLRCIRKHEFPVIRKAFESFTSMVKNDPKEIETTREKGSSDPADRK